MDEKKMTYTFEVGFEGCTIMEIPDLTEDEVRTINGFLRGHPHYRHRNCEMCFMNDDERDGE